MKRVPLRQFVTALILLVAFVCQGTWALAGTTGGLTGNVIDATTSAPIAGATVTASSPSQSATVTTDASGRFSFLTLAPDTYTLSVAKPGYQPVSVPGQLVFADTVQTLSIRMGKSLKTIAHVVAAGVGSLVKSGTTSDVYSINAATQNAVSALGGGNSLNSAYSAVAAVPGAFVVPNQMGYFQTVHIRGGDFDQVGYEFDGVPVNRSFDNYPSTAASSLGNAEVQVYTGATPANAEGQGLAGYINQVIKTGTYPGFATGTLGIGTPTFYHKAAVEIGGSTPDRLFSYYLGIGGYNQDFRYVDNNNGAGYDTIAGAPMSLQPCAGPGGCPWAGGTYYPVGSPFYAAEASLAERDVVGNVHFGIPHHNDAGRDDVQILWDSSSLLNSVYNSTNDIVSTSCPSSDTSVQCANLIGLGTPVYLDGYQWNCGSVVGTTLSAGALDGIGPKCTTNYYFPNSVNRTSPFQPIPLNERDTLRNNQEIVKLQYTKNFGSTAFLRLYGYTYYSDWMQYGPNTTFADFVGCCPPDYRVMSHTRGVSLQFQDQLNEQNLFGIQGGYTTASSIRDNNTQMINFTTTRQYAAVAVNSNDPYGGYCFNATGVQSCDPGLANTPTGAVMANWAQLQSGTAPALPASCAVPGHPAFGTGCTYLMAENSLDATYNSITPRFLSTSLTDEFRPSDKWLFNLGVRLDSFTFIGMNTTTSEIGPSAPLARQFWFNAFNLDNCVNNTTGAVFSRSPGAACPSGSHAANLANVSGQNFTFNIWQPRISGTYTINPDNVLRFSEGRYTEAPNSAFEQYDTLQENLPFGLLGPSFLQYGRTTPGQPIDPPTSINYDLSWEHHFKGTDWSFKVSPFLRQTQGQIQNFFLNQKQGFVSGLNVGSQRSQGFEFQLQKGDFSRNGLSGMLNFAYTNSYIKYGLLSNGLTIINPINGAIGQYNSYTSACAPGGAYYGKSQYGQSLCAGTTNGLPAARCYKPSGTPDPACAAGDIANPYWSSPGQSLINPSQNFPTYSTFPLGIGSSATAFGAPYVASLILNYKANKFAITPTFQFVGGEKYGYPESNPGVDPAAGCSPLAGSNRYNALTCAGTIVIPDTYTGQFDNLGAFTAPNEFITNLQLSYDVSSKVSLTGVLANIVNTCWGGSTEPWTYPDHNICDYGIVGGGGVLPIGNRYNPPGHQGSIIQPLLKYPYEPGFGEELVPKSPFNFYLTAQVRI